MTSQLRESAKRVQELLVQHHLDIQVVEFKETTRTSQEAATVIGCEVGQIAKSLIFKGKSSSKPISVIASGKNRVDEKKITEYVGEEIERNAHRNPVPSGAGLGELSNLESILAFGESPSFRKGVLQKPDADFVLKHTGFAIGGIPPIGFHFDTPPLIDEDLLTYAELWAAAGTPFAVFRITPQDLLKITHGRVVFLRK